MTLLILPDLAAKAVADESSEVQCEGLDASADSSADRSSVAAVAVAVVAAAAVADDTA